ncbi:MAG TPA: mandelate racemase/muconate lactonizing enzyme family protein [Phycisphaerae bacterium]|nr:mandelate racemase/muconate lactonizing enzyme family protein [Thermoguttaceae bacterium]HUU60742.1 mandelate racemase/muconate lactonizing enzyme family protein [Phycisphaerae bacterium]
MELNRRRFLGLAAGAGAVPLVAGVGAARAESGVDVEALERAAAEPVIWPDVVGAPVVIEAVELLKKGREWFVRVRSKDGAEGIAVTNGRGPYLHAIFNQLVAPYFVGKDARELERHLFEVYRFRSNYKLQGLALWCPVAWVEFALLDMLGRIKGQSIAKLTGGVVRREVPFYIASGRRDSTPEEEVEYLAQLVEETGAKAVKFRVGGRMSRNADAMPGRTEKLIPLARKTLGDAIAIHADSNSSYDPPKAIEVGRMLEEIGAVYFEEPCPFDHLEDTKRVADALVIPVAGGEQEYSRRRFRWMIANRGVDVVQPDLHYYGGMIRSIRVARMAAVAGMPTTVHISGGFGFVYMLHFAARTPDIGRYQEYKREIDRYRDWFDPPLASKDGSLVVPSGPGVGIVDIRSVLKGAERVV